ncbi:unnamed protein product [Dicrocoelium dendriticum]|nr:unnamed protein product [Dicrocoelium dendriticum]
MVGSYVRHSREVKNVVLKAYEEGDDWKQVACILKVNVKTCRNWIRAYESTETVGQHGGVRRRALGESHVDCLVEWVSAEPTVTLELLRLRLKAEFEVSVSTSTVSRYLDGRLITMKKLHTIPESMNTLENKKRRRSFVLQLMDYEVEGRQPVWIDETNFNLFCSRTRGRSRRGSRAQCTVANSRGPNVHLVGAMTNNGLIACSVLRGSYNKQRCAQWLRRVLDTNGTGFVERCILICDNAPCHTHLEHVFLEEPYRSGRLLRLAPYSPALNPIEGIWSIIKAHVKQAMKGRYSEMLLGDPEGIMNKSEWRIRFLEHAVSEARALVTQQHCKQMVQHVSKNYGRVVHLADL